MLKCFFQPVAPWYINQPFGANRACVAEDGTNRVVTCDGNNPAPGYRSLYGPGGHKGLDVRATHGQEVYFALTGVIEHIDTDPRSGLDVRIVSTVGGRTFRHIYEHLLGYQGEVGDAVLTGQLIGWADNCFDKETEVLTDHGWKHFVDLTTDDKVVTLNRETRYIEYQKPTKYTRRFERKMYRHINGTTDFCVSIDHNILVERGWRKGRLELEKLGELLTNHSRAPLIINAGWKGADVDTFYLPEFSFKRDRWRTVATKEPMAIGMDDWLAFLGIFLADGNLGQKERNRIVIAQSKPDVIAEIHRLLDRMPFAYWTHTRKQGRNDLVFFNISNNQLYDYLKETGKGANRSVPTFLRELSSRQITIFLNWFFLGDGHERWRDSANWCEKTYYPGLSKPIADMLQELVLKTGYNAVLSTRTANTFEVHEKHSENAYFDPDCVQEIDYNDYSYCVSVPNRTLLVRRNGRAIFLGNTGWSSGDHLHFEVQEKLGREWVSIDPAPLMFNIFARDHLRSADGRKWAAELIARIADNLAYRLRQAGRVKN